MDLKDWEVWDNKDEIEAKVLSECEGMNDESVFGSPIDKEIRMLFADIDSAEMISSEPFPSTSEPFLSTSEPLTSASEPIASTSKPFALTPEIFALAKPSTQFIDSSLSFYEPNESIEQFTVHTNINKIKSHECKGCGKKFIKWEAHYVHAKFKCPLGTYRRKTFECPICLEYKVSKRKSIAVHVASHRKNKKTCPICNQRLNDVINHLLRHHFIDKPNLEVNYTNYSHSHL